jgi:hypothetical protein
VAEIQRCIVRKLTCIGAVKALATGRFLFAGSTLEGRKVEGMEPVYIEIRYSFV